MGSSLTQRLSCSVIGYFLGSQSTLLFLLHPFSVSSDLIGQRAASAVMGPSLLPGPVMGVQPAACQLLIIDSSLSFPHSSFLYSSTHIKTLMLPW